MTTPVVVNDAPLAALGQTPEDVDKAADDDLVLWSVTTVIGALDKPALLYWSAAEAAKAAVDSERTWKGLLEDRGRTEAVKWLRDAHRRPPRDQLKAADLGTVVHNCCEQYALTGRRPTRDEAAQMIRDVGDGYDLSGDALTAELYVVGDMVNRFDGWLQRFTPSYQSTEVCVYSPTYGYAGTADAFLTVDGVRFIGDYKTTRDPRDSHNKPKTPYPEVALQLAAYRHAELAAVWRPRRFQRQRRRYYALSPQEQARAVPVPEVDTGLVIHITPESCESHPVRCDEEIHRAFLYAQEAFRWQQETAKTVIGEPLVARSSA